MQTTDNLWSLKNKLKSNSFLDHKHISILQPCLLTWVHCWQVVFLHLLKGSLNKIKVHEAVFDLITPERSLLFSSFPFQFPFSGKSNRYHRTNGTMNEFRLRMLQHNTQVRLRS